MTTHKIRIAISGGGVAGATLLHALLKYPDTIDVHIFESAPQFREAGVAFGICRNASAALDLIGESAARCLERAGGVPMKGVGHYIGQGKDAGTQVFGAESSEHASGRTTTIVQRANFLRALLEDVPEERMHASKKLVQVEEKSGDGPLVVHFADGSMHECDVLIGADGIHSKVREIVLGKDDPAVAPRNSGFLVIMSLQPYEKARGVLGEAPINIENAREYGWAGNGMMMLHNLLSDGKVVQFAVGFEDQSPPGEGEWTRKYTSGELRERVAGKGWLPHLEKAFVELLCEQAEQSAMYCFEHAPAKTYTNGKTMVLLGDAAHATTPWQASGGGMSIEDSLILAKLLGRARSLKEAGVALEAYDEIRRPRTQRIVESSRGTGDIFVGKASLDPEYLRDSLRHRWDFIIDVDMEAHLQEALTIMDARSAQ